jgi:hypothetical protein
MNDHGRAEMEDYNKGEGFNRGELSKLQQANKVAGKPNLDRKTRRRLKQIAEEKVRQREMGFGSGEEKDESAA